MRKFAISDIHGCLNSFEALLEKIEFSTTDELYILGDYIDRGPDSKGVIDLIWKLQKEGYSIACLRGNHEQMLLSLRERTYHRYDQGDEQLLASFGVKHAIDIPDEYIDWCKQLPYFFEVDEYILVHAGLNFNAEEPLTDLYSMMWIRHWRADIDRKWLNGRIVVHGHTPTPRPTIELYLETAGSTPQIVIDNGCAFYQRHTEMGALCALDLGERKLTFQKHVG